MMMMAFFSVLGGGGWTKTKDCVVINKISPKLA